MPIGSGPFEPETGAEEPPAGRVEPVVGLSCSGVNALLACLLFEEGVAVDPLLLLGVGALLGALGVGIDRPFRTARHGLGLRRRQVAASAAPPAANARDTRSGGSLPCRPMPRTKPFQTFLSHRAKALSPPSSWARTVVDAPAASKTSADRTEPDAMLEIVAAERCHHRPLDTTTLTCQAISPSPQTSALCPRSGHFCGAVSPPGIIQQTDHPGNDGRIGQIEHVPFEAEACGSQVQQDEIRHRAVGDAVDGVADRPAHDQADRQRP